MSRDAIIRQIIEMERLGKLKNLTLSFRWGANSHRLYTLSKFYFKAGDVYFRQVTDQGDDDFSDNCLGCLNTLFLTDMYGHLSNVVSIDRNLF